MNKFYKSFFTIIGMIIIFQQAVFAEIIVDVSGNNITVSGSMNPTSINAPVAIQVLKPNSNIDVLDSTKIDLLVPYIEYLGQTFTDASGGLTPYTFSQYGKSGIYTIKLKIDGISTPVLKTYTYTNSEDIKTAIAEINSTLQNNTYTLEQKANSIKNTMNLNFELLQLGANFTLYSEMVSAGISIQPVYESIAKMSSIDFDTLRSTFKTNVLLIAINSTTAENIKAYINDYATILSLNQIMKAKYVLMPNALQTEVCSNLCGKHYADLSSFANGFNESVFLTQVNNVKIYGDIEEILSSTSSIIGVDLSEFNDLSNTNKGYVLQKLAESKYGNLNDFKTKFNNLIAQYSIVKPSNNTNVGGGSSPSKIVTANISQLPVETVEYFKDIKDVEWAISAIEKLHNKGIISDDVNREFRPNDVVSREEFVKMLIVGLGLKYNNEIASFSDVLQDAWYYQYISLAKNYNIVNGMNDNTFGVGIPVTRQDIAVMISRGAKVGSIELNSGGKSIFNDDLNIAEYAKDAVYELKSAGIINGKDDSHFEPTAFATRAEVAKMIFGLIGGAE